jgi:hypothetical protein
MNCLLPYNNSSSIVGNMIRHFHSCSKSAAANADGESEFQSSHCDELRRLSLSDIKAPLVPLFSPSLLIGGTNRFLQNCRGTAYGFCFLKRGEKALMASSFCLGFPDFKKT